jgi:hypothetical protein
MKDNCEFLKEAVNYLNGVVYPVAKETTKTPLT